jgi:hypothetical protein
VCYAKIYFGSIRLSVLSDLLLALCCGYSTKQYGSVVCWLEGRRKVCPCQLLQWDWCSLCWFQQSNVSGYDGPVSISVVCVFRVFGCLFWFGSRKSYERYRRGGDSASYFCISMFPMIISWLREVHVVATVSYNLRHSFYF